MLYRPAYEHSCYTFLASRSDSQSGILPGHSTVPAWSLIAPQVPWTRRMLLSCSSFGVDLTHLVRKEREKAPTPASRGRGKRGGTGTRRLSEGRRDVGPEPLGWGLAGRCERGGSEERSAAAVDDREEEHPAQGVGIADGSCRSSPDIQKPTRNQRWAQDPSPVASVRDVGQLCSTYLIPSRFQLPLLVYCRRQPPATDP